MKWYGVAAICLAVDGTAEGQSPSPEFYLEYEGLEWSRLTTVAKKSSDSMGNADREAQDKTTAFSTGSSLSAGGYFTDYAFKLSTSSVQFGYVMNRRFIAGLYLSYETKTNTDESYWSSKKTSSTSTSTAVGPYVAIKFLTSSPMWFDTELRLAMSSSSEKEDATASNGTYTRTEFKSDTGMALFAQGMVHYRLDPRFSVGSGFSYLGVSSEYDVEDEDTSQTPQIVTAKVASSRSILSFNVATLRLWF